MCVTLPLRASPSSRALGFRRYDDSNYKETGPVPRLFALLHEDERKTSSRIRNGKVLQGVTAIGASNDNDTGKERIHYQDSRPSQINSVADSKSRSA